MDKQLTLLKSQLTELNLKNLATNLDDLLLASCSTEKTNAQFLQEALEIELSQRRKAGLGKRLRYANLPIFDKELDVELYDFGQRSGISRRQILELSSNFVWIDKAFNIIFLGGSGLGKSFLACYLGYKAMEIGYNVSFVSMNELSQLLRTEQMLSRSRSRMKRIRACDLLILDEVGNTVLDRQESNKVFQLICDFYQQTSIILTSNKGFDEWTGTLGDAVVTTAVLDRLMHKCEVFNIGGDSWRMSNHKTILDDLLKAGDINA